MFASQLTTAQASDYSFAEVGKSKEKESMSKLKKIARYLGMTPREVLVQLAEGDQAQSDPPEATTRKDDFETVWTELARLSTGLEKCVAMCEELAQKMEAYEIANDMKDGDSGDANASAAKPDAQASANDPSPQLAAERAMLVTLKQLTQEAASSIETSLAAIPVNLRAETQAKLIAMAQSAGEMSLLSSTLYRPTQDKRDRKQIFFDHLRRDPRDEKELDRFFQHNKHLSVQ